jgi:hypothetical protein
MSQQGLVSHSPSPPPLPRQMWGSMCWVQCMPARYPVLHLHDTHMESPHKQGSKMSAMAMQRLSCPEIQAWFVPWCVGC